MIDLFDGLELALKILVAGAIILGVVLGVVGMLLKIQLFG